MTVLASPEYYETAQRVKSALLQQMFGVATAEAAGATRASTLSTEKLPMSNIVGVGYGAKVVSDHAIDLLAVRVYVRTKLPLAALGSELVIPESIDGVPTDVIPVGDLAAQFPRPVRCGVSCGHPGVPAGTIGCIVTSNGTNRFILSNNHVLANVNEATLGDQILEPGRLDGGTTNPPIARLTAYQPIDFDEPNRIDAALAELIHRPDVESRIDEIGPIVAQPMDAALHQTVRKHGRTTLGTRGVVTDLAADVLVRYGSKVAQFNDQIAVSGMNGVFSAGGDSGSLVVEAATHRPVGLLFAGGGTTTFCNHLPVVLDRFGVSIV
jgi:hypothetical protein